MNMQIWETPPTLQAPPTQGEPFLFWEAGLACRVYVHVFACVKVFGDVTIDFFHDMRYISTVTTTAGWL